MPLYIGKPGNLLTLPAPRRGAPATPDYGAVTLGTLDGGRVVQRLAGAAGKRTWAFDWPAMALADRLLLRALVERAYGPGPFVMYDPGQVNLLTPNQSAGTDPRASTVGFTASQGTIASTTATYAAGQRALLWTMASSPSGTPHVELVWPHGQFGYPVLPSTEYTFFSKVSGSSATFSLRLDMVWTDAAGATLSTSSGAASSPAGVITTYGDRTVTATSPSNAVYCRPRLVAVTTVASGTVGFDLGQFQLGPATAWQVGLGLPLVSIPELSPVYQYRALHDMAAAVVEVGRAA